MALTYPQPILDIFTGYLIKLSHRRLIIDADFELTQEVTLEYFTDDGEGGFGLPVEESIRLNPNISEEQKARLVNAFSPATRTASTRGFMLDGKTLEVVRPDENGNFPEGAIKENVVWLNVLAEQVPGKKLSEKVKSLLLESMGKMVQRGRI